MANALQRLHRLPPSFLRHIRSLQVFRSLSDAGNPDKGSSKTPQTTEGSTTSDAEVYKVQEYFKYNDSSYYDLEESLRKFRLEQPRPGIKY